MNPKSLNSLFADILLFPVDCMRLCLHAWKMLFEAIRYERQWKCWEHSCIFCRDIDKSLVPRNMCKTIKYRNLWMIRLLLPELETFHSKNGHRRLPMCRNDSGTVRCSPLRALAIGLITILIWMLLAYGLFFRFQLGT